jgi:short-subunit dehydrogenase
MAVTELPYLFVQEMVRRKTGHILLVASILGYQPTAGYAVYRATKAYVLLFLCACGRAEKYLRLAGADDGAQPVARMGIRAMLGRRSSVVAGFLNRFVIFSNRLTPRSVQSRIMQRALSG